MHNSYGFLQHHNLKNKSSKRQSSMYQNQEVTLTPTHHNYESSSIIMYEKNGQLDNRLSFTAALNTLHGQSTETLRVFCIKRQLARLTDLFKKHPQLYTPSVSYARTFPSIRARPNYLQTSPVYKQKCSSCPHV